MLGSCGTGVVEGVVLGVDVIVTVGVAEGVTDGVGVTEGDGVVVGVGVALGDGVTLGVGVTVGVIEGVGVTVGVAVGVGVGVATKHAGRTTALISRVTAPLRASTRPSTCAPVVTVTEVSAMIVPLNVELVPSVAELPTCQKTLHACALFASTIVLAPAVVSVEFVLNIKIAFGSPCASRVSVPVRANVPPADVYVPGVFMVPPSSVAVVVAA